ncbi:hypothetical protein PENSOL_c011G06662 [Penicillium solitum]|uniref:Uncharacterized protein n=1 Tax=Penicillium solitum TaxID=60172 RepID=A0A1V6R8T3_9EURO|nr:uncharacterized protein PENSOL_c011G06662 [Penicillium solitum]OQD97616.1 hypothetical protein PENSOL_c011G06662 [Penicillium solitum]
MSTREGDGDSSIVSREKPTSLVLTIGVPAAITGVIVAVAIIVCVTIYYRRHKRDKQTDLEYAKPGKKFYNYDNATQTRRAIGHASTNGAPNRQNGTQDISNPSSSRYSSDSSLFEFKEHGGAYKLLSLSRQVV